MPIANAVILFIGSKSGNSSDGFAGMKTTVEAGAGGCGNGAKISFQTWGCGISSSRDVMTLSQWGYVGIGTAAPATKLDVFDSGAGAEPLYLLEGVINIFS